MLRAALVLLILCSSLFASQNDTELTSQDVKGVMEGLFELHIDQQEMSALILERSLKIYLNQFDPSHAYLLQEEAFPYLHPNSQLLHAMHQEYARDQYTTYFALNNTIAHSIKRAREWRTHWEQNPKKMIADARKVDLGGAPDKDYARSKKALKARHYDRMLRFLAFQMEELGIKDASGKESKLIALCEKQVRIMENTYLGVDDNNHALSSSQQEHQVILRTLKALAQSLDTHTAYYSPEEAFAMKVQLEKGMSGIGVVMREGIDGITIHEIINGGPAAKSGQLHPGDTVVEIDGESIQGAPFRSVLDLMRGKEGTTITLGVVRSSGDYQSVDLVRRQITLNDKRVDVEAEPYGDGYIGKITLHSFYEGADGISSEKDLKNAIDTLRAKGPLYGLVLDMRDNGGGFLTQAVKVSGLFISNGVVVISKYSDGSVKYYRTVEGDKYYDGPLVVLVSKGSASATEIVAQTLQDYGVAVVVGDERTYGKGTIQHQTVTGNGKNSFFKVTVGRYYTVSGKSTQIEGVKSDILVPSPYHYEELGEGHLDYPLPPDHVAPAYDDNLADIDPFARKWFEKYYTSTLQQRESTWQQLLPTLRANSQKRIAQNQNYQHFLAQIKKELQPIDTIEFGTNDLQMDESTNIVKDMIYLQEKLEVKQEAALH